MLKEVKIKNDKKDLIFASVILFFALSFALVLALFLTAARVVLDVDALIITPIKLKVKLSN